MLKENYQKLKSTLGLSWQLAKANFKLRNEGSYLGILWYLLAPLIYFIVLVGLFQGNIGSNIPNYPLYVLLGLIMFNFFSGTTSRATRMVIENAGFIKSMKVNYFSLILANILQFTFSHIFELILFIGFMIYYHLALIPIFYYLLVFIVLTIFIIGISFIISAIGVYINDLDSLWQVFLMVLWILTPIFYSAEQAGYLPLIVKLNPLTYFLTIARDLIIYSRIPSIHLMLLLFLISIVTFGIGILIFNILKSRFAERV